MIEYINLDTFLNQDEQNRFYCFPHKKDVVAKMRLVTEETFKLKKNNI